LVAEEIEGSPDDANSENGNVGSGCSRHGLRRQLEGYKIREREREMKEGEKEKEVVEENDVRNRSMCCLIISL